MLEKRSLPLLLLFLSALAVIATDRQTAVDAVSARDLMADRNAVTLVDVRDIASHDLGHIEGDLWIPIYEFADRVAEVPRDKPVVVYCGHYVQQNSKRAVQMLAEAGFEKAAILARGFAGWRAIDGPVVSVRTPDEVFAIGEHPKGWMKTPVDQALFAYDRDQDFVYAGEASGRLSARTEEVNWNNSVPGFFQKLDAAPLKGRTMRLQAQVRVQNASNGAVLWMRLDDAKGNSFAFVHTYDRPIDGTRDWQDVSLEIAVVDPAVDLVFGVLSQDTGTVWVDEVTLTALDEKPEEDLAVRAGFTGVGLGPRILRTETAPLAAITLAQARWGDLPFLGG